MAYQFRLEALKRYRHHQEELCQKAFAEAQRAHEKETLNLMKLIDKRNETEAQMNRTSGCACDGPTLCVYAAYLERLSRQIASQRIITATAQKQCDEKRQGLIMAMQKRKTLEKLKESGLKDHLQHLNREEQKFINEMAINRHILKSK